MSTKLDVCKIIYESDDIQTREKIDMINEVRYLDENEVFEWLDESIGSTISKYASKFHSSRVGANSNTMFHLKDLANKYGVKSKSPGLSKLRGMVKDIKSKRGLVDELNPDRYLARNKLTDKFRNIRTGAQTDAKVIAKGREPRPRWPVRKYTPYKQG